MIKKISDYQQVTYHPVAQKWQFLCKIHDIFKKKNVLVLLQRISYFDNCILTSLNRIANSSYCVLSLLNTSIIRAQTAFCTLLIETLGFYCLGVMLLLGFRVRTIFTSFSETSFFFAVKFYIQERLSMPMCFVTLPLPLLIVKKNYVEQYQVIPDFLM